MRSRNAETLATDSACKYARPTCPVRHTIAGAAGIILLSAFGSAQTPLRPASAPASTSASAPGSAPGNPLAGLPSPPGGHIGKLKALGDNEWLVLGPPEGDPRWGQARGRSWTPKMPYAPDLGGAFLCGTGMHGFVKPDGHFMDDLWFYDARAHRWICLYPGAEVKTLRLRLDARGLEVNDRGEPVPVSYMSHGYNNQTYNTDLRKFVALHTQCPWWTKGMPQRWEWLDQTDQGVRTKNYGTPGPVIGLMKHPWFFDVAAGKWERRFVEGPGPGRRFEGVLEYVPPMKKAFLTYASAQSWLYDFASNAWTPVPGEGGKVPASVAAYDQNGCYDPKHQRVYVAKGKGFACFDLKAMKWSEVKADGQPEDLGACVNACLFYDSVNDVVLWHGRGAGEDREQHRLAAYDPEANKWTALGDTYPREAVKTSHSCVSGFYDGELNVHFYYLAGDSDLTKAAMLAYRYKRTPKP